MDTADTPSIVDQISNQIQSYLPEWYDSRARVLTPPEVRRHNWSYILRFPLEGVSNTPAVLVKIPRRPDMDIVQAATQDAKMLVAKDVYDQLVALEQHYKDYPEFASIHPLAFPNPWNAIVMEEIQARSLNTVLAQPHLIFGNHPDWETIIQVLGRATKWLQIYHHELGEIKAEPLDRVDFISALERTLTRILDVSPQLDLQPVRKLFASAWESIRDYSLPFVNLHGDFTCANILFNQEKRVLVIDIDASRGPIYVDIAKLLADIETRRYQILSLGKFYRASSLKSCREIIINTYFGSQPYSCKTLTLYQAMVVLDKWRADEENRVKSIGRKRYVLSLTMPNRRHYFRSMIFRLLKEFSSMDG